MIGKIPKDWEVTKLSNLIEVETGKRAKGGALEKGNVASIGGEQIDDEGNILWDEMKFIPEDFYDSLKQGKVKLGDVLLVKDGATTGKVAIVKNLKYEKVAVNEHVFIIRSKARQLINEFLFYFLFSKFGQIQIKARFHGLIGGIIRSDLETILIPLPPLIEQQKIAEILSTVDEAIQKTNEIIAKTERLKKALMNELLTGKIRVKEENGKLVFYRETDFQDIETGKIPREWKIVKLKDVVEPRKEIADPTQVDPSTPYVGLEHVDSGDIELRRYGKAEDVKSTKLKFYKRDILYGKLRPYLDKAVISHLDGVCSTDFIVMKTRHNVKPEYLIWVLHTNEFIKYATQTMKGTNHPRTSWESLASYALGLPPINEQELIAHILDNMVRLKDLYIREKGKLDRLKRGLMDLLLSGRVRVLE